MSKFSKSLDNYFGITKSGSKITTEIIAGVTTFFTMAYILFVNPDILGQADGMPKGAIFLATIFASVAGTLVMGLFAKVPYAQAPGMGLNAFFTFTVVKGFGFSWQAALAMVFICGVINIIITVTKVRKMIIKAIPRSLQHAIGAGIGIFIAYIGLKNAGWLQFTADPGTYNEAYGTIFANSSIVPALTDFANSGALVALFGLILTIVLLVCKVKGAIIIGIVGAALVNAIAVLAIPGASFGVDVGKISATSWGKDFSELGTTFGAAFYQGFPDLFLKDPSKLPMAFLAIFAFSLTDTFDTIGTFIGTGRKSGIFSDEDEKALEEGSGFNSKMDKALFADSIATSVGAIFGTSNTTTYVESAAGIGAGGRTGLTSVVVAALFLLSILLSPIISFVPSAATASALILVGVMMMSSVKDIEWDNLEEAIPAFFAVALMALAYNISIGIAFAFILHVLIKLVRGKIKEVHPIMYVSAGLFLLYFIFMGVNGAITAGYIG